MNISSSLVSAETLLTHARKNFYAIPAFNIENFDALIGVLDGASASGSPLIIQATQPAIENLGIENLVAVTKLEAAARRLPVALHLDHGENLAFIFRCLEAGFSSVMFDGSRLALSENIATTRQVVQHATNYGASVEAALGGIGSDEAPVVEKASAKLDALQLVEETKAHVLAVAIGSVHGMRSRELELDLDILAQIAQQVPVPLVLHGSSGVKEEQILKAIKHGIAKVNLETELRILFRKALQESLERNPKEIKPRNLMRPVREAIASRVAQYQTALGAAGQARELN